MPKKKKLVKIEVEVDYRLWNKMEEGHEQLYLCF